MRIGRFQSNLYTLSLRETTGLSRGELLPSFLDDENNNQF